MIPAWSPLLAFALGGAPGARAAGDEDSLYLADIGVTAVLPDGWRVPRWSDDYLDAIDDGKRVQVHVESTFFQVEVNQDAARTWGELAGRRLEDLGHEKPELLRAEVLDGGVAEVELGFRYKGRRTAPGVLFQRSFPVDGRTVHVSAMALRRNKALASRAARLWAAALQVDKPPQDLSSTSGEVGSKAGFSVTLPGGWRRPLRSEMPHVQSLAADLGAGRVDEDRCAVGIRPDPAGHAALLLPCQAGMYLGVVDSWSFEGEEPALRKRLFPGGKVDVPPARPVPTAGDRLSFAYHPPAPEGRELRLAVTPYDKGVVLTWLLSDSGQDVGLDEALTDMLGSMRFTGPDGGRPPVGFDQYIAYLLRYRRSSPLVWGPLAVLCAIGVALVLRRAGRRKRWEDL